MKLNTSIKVKLLCGILWVSIHAIAQQTQPYNTEYPGYNRFWFFGNKAGLDFGADYSQMQAIQGMPSYSPNGEYEGTAVLSNNNGELIAYSFGQDVYDRNFVKVPGTFDAQNTPLLGYAKSSHQKSIFVPNPNKPCEFYLFGVMSESLNSNQWRKLSWNRFVLNTNYSISPQIIGQQASLTPEDNAYTSSIELIHAFRSPINDGKKRYFVITTRNGKKSGNVGGKAGGYNKFIVGYVDKDTDQPYFYGIDGTIPLGRNYTDLVQDGYFNSSSSWAIKVSPDGSKLALNCDSSSRRGFFLYDIGYDGAGKINAITFKKFVQLSSYCDAMDFDRDSRFIYAATRGKRVNSGDLQYYDARVYQYDSNPSTQPSEALKQMFTTGTVQGFPSQYILGMVVKRPGNNDDMIVAYREAGIVNGTMNIRAISRIVNSQLSFTGNESTGAFYRHQDIWLAPNTNATVGFPNQLYYGAEFNCSSCEVECCPTLISSKEHNLTEGNAIDNPAQLRSMFTLRGVGSGTYRLALSNSPLLYSYFSRYVDLIRSNSCQDISLFKINWRAYRISDNAPMTFSNGSTVVTSTFVPGAMSYTNMPNVGLLPYVFTYATGYKIELEILGELANGFPVTFPNCPKNYFILNESNP